MKFQFVELNRCTTATPIIAATIICRNNNTRHPVLQVDSIGTQLCPPIIQLPITANTSTIITTIQVNNIQQLQQLQNGNSNMQQQYATFAANGICMLLLSTCPKHCFFVGCKRIENEHSHKACKSLIKSATFFRTTFNFIPNIQLKLFFNSKRTFHGMLCILLQRNIFLENKSLQIVAYTIFRNPK